MNPLLQVKHCSAGVPPLGMVWHSIQFESISEHSIHLFKLFVIRPSGHCLQTPASSPYPKVQNRVHEPSMSLIQPTLQELQKGFPFTIEQSVQDSSLQSTQ